MITPTGTGNGSLKIFIRSEISRGCRPVTAQTAGKDPSNKKQLSFITLCDSRNVNQSTSSE
ncbi:hypothetical protein D7N50_14940 [Salmonella enterica subsp. enterica serovar Abony]|nr:hypothetical protein [Salmonella enterica subsp. enterica serovar Abony]